MLLLFFFLKKKDTEGEFPSKYRLTCAAVLMLPAYYTSERMKISRSQQSTYFHHILKDNITAAVELENEQSRHVMSFTQITPHLLLCIIFILLLFAEFNKRERMQNEEGFENFFMQCCGRETEIRLRLSTPSNETIQLASTLNYT